MRNQQSHSKAVPPLLPWYGCARGWLGLFSAAYGLQSLLAAVQAHSPDALIDLRVFFAAARVAAQGANPYAPSALAAMEHVLFPRFRPLAGAGGLRLPYMHGPLPLL